MTRRSNIVGIEGGGGQARAETRTLLDYAGHHRPPVGGPAEAGNLSASNLSLTLNTDFERDRRRQGQTKTDCYIV